MESLPKPKIQKTKFQGDSTFETSLHSHLKVDLSNAPWTMHEFFAGSGLVAYGLKDMFRPIWANDISPEKARVYSTNLDAEHLQICDIKDITGTSLPFAHLSWASFPCQDLSLAGTIGGIHAPRSGLVWEWLRILDEQQDKPLILTIENVTGLLSSDKGENYRKLHTALSDRGYNSGAIVLDANLFVPQSRQRVFIIAVKRGYSIPESLTDAGPNWLHNKTVSELGKSLPGWIWWKAEKPPLRLINLENIIDKMEPYDKDYVVKLIPKRHLEKIAQTNATYATGYRRTRQGQQRLEIRCDGIAGCLRTPEGGSSKQFLIFNFNNQLHARLLTVREVARLMGAPDDFSLPGSYNDGYKAMGDAVVLPVARFIGESLLLKIAEAVYGK